MSRSVAATLFDVDGTLVDTNYLHTVVWWEAFLQAEYEVPMAWTQRVIGMSSDQLLDACGTSGPGLPAQTRPVRIGRARPERRGLLA